MMLSKVGESLPRPLERLGGIGGAYGSRAAPVSSPAHAPEMKGIFLKGGRTGVFVTLNHPCVKPIQH